MYFESGRHPGGYRHLLPALRTDIRGLAARGARGEECERAARAFERLGAGARQSLARRRANLEQGQERLDERTKFGRDAYMRFMWLSGVL